MHFATPVRTWRVARLYSEIALSRKASGIGHMYMYTFLLRMGGAMTFRPGTFCIASDVMMNDELKGIWKETAVAKLQYYPGICLERLRWTIKHVTQDSQSLGRESNKAPIEYVSRALQAHQSARCVPSGIGDRNKHNAHPYLKSDKVHKDWL
jgi:hypothetical protein